jgi:CxxC motif-containing protein (DUF1111 family)
MRRFLDHASVVLIALGLCPLVGCSGQEPGLVPTATGGAAPGSAHHGDAFDVPIDGVSQEQARAFFQGDELFDLPLRDSDGLGPLYTRSACGACHDKGARGPGTVQKMSVVLADGITTSPDQSKLPFGPTVHPLCTAGATTPVLPPDDPAVRLSFRVGPPVLGRGYLEAVDDMEILRVEAEQVGRGDGIRGRVNHVVYASEPNPDPTFNPHQKGDRVIGRFGLKARIATLDEFTADALQGDMGITSPLRPVEIPNPDGLTDDDKPGIDVTAESVNRRAMYVRLTAIPERAGLTDAGRALFEGTRCAACHVPSLKTRADYPIDLLAGIDAPVFTDMLLHDMGDTLADGMTEGGAGPRDWRTAPLIGLRFDKAYLHDGRAHSVEEAINLHDGRGSEAAASVALFRALSPADHDALVAFVSAL